MPRLPVFVIGMAAGLIRLRSGQEQLENHLLCAFVAILKIVAIYALYPGSFCDKNLAIRKVFAFCDSDHLAQSCTIFHHLAPSCIILHHLAPSCTILHHLAPSCTMLHHVPPCCTMLHYVAPRCTTLHHVAPRCTMLHHVAPCCTM